METNVGIRIFLIVCIVILAIFNTFPLKDKINLGLDLQGGMHLILQVDTSGLSESAKRDAPARALEVIRNRIDEFGVKEPVIQLQGEDQIVVQLPGVTERERAIQLIKKTAVLEFKLVSGDSDKLKKAKEGHVPDGYELASLDNNDILLEKNVLLRGDTIVDAKVDFESGGFGRPYVQLKFNDEGAKKFAQITGENVGRLLAIILDGKVYSAPRINELIPSGEARITGNFSIKEAKDLALVLRVGSLPAPVTLAEERTIGPLLGKDSINAGLRASIFGLLAVFIFMFLYYGFSGIIANIALLLNLLIIFGYIGLFHATLTLPGIAGIILTLGMAVDANVLINERIREELRNGRPIQTAINIGYRLAFGTILDANITTLIAAFFLFQFGTGPIRGFAVTLSVGLIASIFTAVIVTKTIIDILFSYPSLRLKITPFSMLDFMSNTRINFIRQKNVWLVVSSILFIGSLFLVFSKGKDALGIDFSGGQLQEYRFKEPIPIELIRKSLQAAGLQDASILRFKDSATDIVIRTKSDTSQIVQRQFKKDFADNPFEVLRIENVGPVVGRMLMQKAFLAIIWSLIGILIYVAVRFKHFDFAIGGVVALIHDVVISTGALLLINRQIDLLIITALLTLAGYSINDTIVVYDRIRELMRKIHKVSLIEIINTAINQTLARTILTSFTTLLVVIFLFLFGGEVLNSFAFVLLVGFVIGTYSSIFIAAPIVIAFRNLLSSKR